VKENVNLLLDEFARRELLTEALSWQTHPKEEYPNTFGLRILGGRLPL
jgi:hypothetical protein